VKGSGGSGTGLMVCGDGERQRQEFISSWGFSRSVNNRWTESFDFQRNQGWMEGSSGRTGHAQCVGAEIQGKEEMEPTGAEEARESVDQGISKAETSKEEEGTVLKSEATVSPKKAPGNFCLNM